MTSPRSNVILVGAGGLAREVIAAVDDGQTFRVVGLVDDDPDLRGSHLMGVEVIGHIDEIQSLAVASRARVVVCIGRGDSRRRVVARLAQAGIGQGDYATVVHRSVSIPKSCSISSGSILLAGVVLTADVSLGRHVLLMPNVTLTHDDVINDYATLCAGVSLGGGVQVGEAAYLGMNAGARENTCIGAGSTLGMGSVLLADVPDEEVWVGVPARFLSKAVSW